MILIGPKMINTFLIFVIVTVWILSTNVKHVNSDPSADPSIVPSTFPPSQSLTSPPSKIPTVRPSRKPSSKPTILPSLLPSAVPSPVPTVLPSCIPSSTVSTRPTFTISSIPTTLPSLPPSTKPSSHPTLPTGAPTSNPSTQPSTQPSVNPSTSPTQRPSQPTSQPTSLPSSRPSNHPTSCPTVPPSSIPSSSPTEIPLCNAGYYYVFQYSDSAYDCLPCPAGSFSGNNSQYCDPCPMGSYSQEGQAYCSFCPKGSYANDEGSENCQLCPINFYTNIQGSISCVSCPPNQVNGAPGGISKNQCVNPALNFVIGYLCLIFCLVALGPYIIGNRLRRVSFLRKERLVKHASILFNLIFSKLITIDRASIELNSIEQNRIRARILAEGKTLLRKVVDFIKMILFTLLVASLFSTIVIYYVFITLIQIIFKSLIIWRGYHQFFDIPDYLPSIRSFVYAVTRVIDISYITVLFSYAFYPIFIIANYLAHINIDLSSIKISCAGSQAPIKLFVNCFVAGFIVIVIESDMAVFWLSSFKMANQKFMTLAVNRYFVFRNGSFPNKDVCKYVSASVVLSLIPSPIKLVQYLIGFVAISYLIDDNGRSASSSNCNGMFYMDEILAIASTVGGFLLLFPIIYLFSQILVPSFPVEYSNKSVLNDVIADEELLRKDYEEEADQRVSLIEYRERQQQQTQQRQQHLQDMTQGMLLSENMSFDQDGYIRIMNNINTHTVNTPNHHELDQINGWFEDETAVVLVVDYSKRQRDIMMNKTRITLFRLVYRVYQVLSFPFSFDWLYVRVAYNYGYHIYKMTSTFLETLEVLPEVYQSNKLKVILATQTNSDAIKPATTFLPTFPLRHFFAKNRIKSQDMRQLIDENYYWLVYQRDFPSYYHLMSTTYDDYQQNNIYFPRKEDFNCVVRILSNLFSLRFVYPFNYFSDFTIFSQLRSKRGNLIWRRVILNYWIFFIASFGIWTDYVEENYHIVDKYKEFVRMNERYFYGNGDVSEEFKSNDSDSNTSNPSNRNPRDSNISPMDRPIMNNRTISSNINGIIQNPVLESQERNLVYNYVPISTSLTPTPTPLGSSGILSGDNSNNAIDTSIPLNNQNASIDSTINYQPEIRIKRFKRRIRSEAEEKEFFSSYLAGYVGTRIVLMQLIPILTGLSIFAVDFASSPIFVTNKELLELLPSFIVSPAEARRLSILQLKEQLNFAVSISSDIDFESRIPSWKIHCLSVYIFVFHSRFIQFLLKAYINIVSVMIVASNQRILDIISITGIVLLLIGIVRALYGIVLLHKLFFSVEYDDEDETAARHLAERLQMEAEQRQRSHSRL